jgi:hypothetical protein
VCAASKAPNTTSHRVSWRLPYRLTPQVWLALGGATNHHHSSIHAPTRDRRSPHYEWSGGRRSQAKHHLDKLGSMAPCFWLVFPPRGPMHLCSPRTDPAVVALASLPVALSPSSNRWCSPLVPHRQHLKIERLLAE